MLTSTHPWLALLRILFWIVSPLKSQSRYVPTHKHWAVHIDRQFTLEYTFPIIGELVGDKGKFLEVGFDTAYNNEDTKAAGISPEQFYFAEPYLRGEWKPEYGRLIPTGFQDVPGEYNNTFTAIMDYGLIGAHPHHIEPFMDKYVSTYSRLLKPGGMLFLKVDGWQKRNPYYWPIVNRKISKTLVMVHRHEVMSAACNYKGGAHHLQHFRESEYNSSFPGASSDLNAFKNTTTLNCEQYLFVQYYNPGNLYSPERAASVRFS